MSELQATEQALKDFILREFLEGDESEELTAETPLVSSGIMDSLATLKLVSWLEEEFGFAIEPHEADEEHLDTIGSIVALIASKRGCS